MAHFKHSLMECFLYHFSSDFHEKIYKYDFHSMTVTPFIGIIMSMKVIDGGEIMDFPTF